jgi:hypothetical protein
MVRIQSIRALALILGEESEMFCDQMRRDGERLVRAEAIRCYGAAGLTKRASQLDETARTDKDPLMRASAVNALGQLKDHAVQPMLVTALRDPDFTVETAAVEAIGLQEYKAAAPAVMEAYRARPEREFVDVQLEAVRVLGDLGALEAQPLLVEATSHEDVRVRVAAVESLKKLKLPAPELPSERTFRDAAFNPARKKQLAPPLGARLLFAGAGAGQGASRGRKPSERDGTLEAQSFRISGGVQDLAVRSARDRASGLFFQPMAKHRPALV